jgi:AraC-like DNA-binding protein
MTFTEHVNELRLQWAFALLTEAHDNERRISDIALDAGFPTSRTSTGYSVPASAIRPAGSARSA